MDSEYHTYEAEPSITNIQMKQIASGTNIDPIHDMKRGVVKEEAPEIELFSKCENEQNSSGNQFGDVLILKREVVEEEPFSEFGRSLDPNKWLEKNENKRFHGPDSSEFEVMRSNSVEDLKKISHFCENTNFNELAGELAKVNHFSNGVILKDENHSECNDSSSINAEWKMETIKTEDDIKRIYKDLKLEICEEIQSVKSEIERTQCKSCCKPFQCRICLKRFVEKSKFLIHERIHTGEKPFQCKICTKSFSQKGNLTKHEIIHTGEKPFRCKVCGASFANKSTLLKHEIIHTGKKPFQCKICLKSFIRKSHLTRHEKIHTGKNPFNTKFV